MNATLENILCVIHRDGGHYIAEHGIQKAFDDALEIHYRQRNAEERLSTIVQQSLSGSDDKSSSAQICNDFEEGERCTKGLNSTCGKCGYLSDADF